MPKYVVFIVYITFVEIVWKRKKNILFFCFMKSIFIVNSHHVCTYKRQEQLKLNISPSKSYLQFSFHISGSSYYFVFIQFLVFCFEANAVKGIALESLYFWASILFAFRLLNNSFSPYMIISKHTYINANRFRFISIPCDTFGKSIQ